MQRVIGALLIITATSGAGYLYGADLKRYLDKMVYLRYIAGLIKGEMEYTGAPLPEIFRGIGSRVQEPYASWLKNISAEIDLREESAFARIWNRGVDRYLKELGLRSAHSILLKELGISPHFYRMLPYLITLIVLAFTSKKSRAPKAEGIPYDKGQR